MALVACRECGREISKKAKVCPGCGTNRPQGRSIIVTTFYWCFGLAILMAIFGPMFNPESSSSNTPAPPQSSTPAARAPAATPPAVTGGSGNESQDVLMQLSESDQAATFGKLLNSSGYGCKPTVAMFSGMDREKSAYWSVGCEAGESYMVTLPPGRGNSKIMECGALKLVGVECFKPFE